MTTIPNTVEYVIESMVAYNAANTLLKAAQVGEVQAFERSAIATYRAINAKVGGPDTAQTIATAAAERSAQIQKETGTKARVIGLYTSKPMVWAHAFTGRVLATFTGDLPSGITFDDLQTLFTMKRKLDSEDKSAKPVNVTREQLDTILLKPTALDRSSVYKLLKAQTDRNFAAAVKDRADEKAAAAKIAANAAANPPAATDDATNADPAAIDAPPATVAQMVEALDALTTTDIQPLLDMISSTVAKARALDVALTDDQYLQVVAQIEDLTALADKHVEVTPAEVEQVALAGVAN